jgi:Cytochrome c oxidase caa3 assembly factor (Caa3_CtaG)
MVRFQIERCRREDVTVMIHDHEAGTQAWRRVHGNSCIAQCFYCRKVAVAAPLLAYSRPGAALLRSMPLPWRKGAGELLNSRLVKVPWTTLRQPIFATILQAVALWTWHAPPLYLWALKDPAAHRLEHLSLFLTALLFWWTLFHWRGGLRSKGSNPLTAIGRLFLTMMQSGALGALLTFWPGLWYPDQEKLAADFGVTPLEDQQMAGPIMWAPMGLLYTAVALYFAQVLLSRPTGTVQIAAFRSRRTQGRGQYDNQLLNTRGHFAHRHKRARKLIQQFPRQVQRSTLPGFSGIG